MTDSEMEIGFDLAHKVKRTPERTGHDALILAEFIGDIEDEFIILQQKNALLQERLDKLAQPMRELQEMVEQAPRTLRLIFDSTKG